ncbi:MAG TPA: hypothetical protein VGT61_15660 [Thermomicrobiales bacterium]|jgi:hypothetical protein|nr:hypothetical protein [Thermomicrobiales bacterium]
MVVAQTPPPVRTTRTTHAYREPKGPPPAEDKAAVWAFVWTLFAFKMATVGIIMWKNPGYVTNILVLVTTWFWFVVPMIALSAPAMFRWRLMKLRKRREALRRSEWELG